MSNLKELTWEHHKNAERQGFVKVMMSGRINPRFYATYLWNQHKKYDILEAMAGASGILDDLPDIRRKTKIDQVLKKYCEDANGREKYKKLEGVLKNVVKRD